MKLLFILLIIISCTPMEKERESCRRNRDWMIRSFSLRLDTDVSKEEKIELQKRVVELANIDCFDVEEEKKCCEC